MILNKGEKVHIIERRYFNEDPRRHFIGEVVRCTENAMRVKGHAWVYDYTQMQFTRKSEERERVVIFGDRMTVNVIPPAVNLSELKYVTTSDKSVVVTDGKKFSLDITEFTEMR